MSIEQINLARRWFEEVWNQRRDESIDELITPESWCDADGELLRGREEFLERMRGPFLGAFPDLRVEVEGIIAQDDHVAVRWSATGTHRGDHLGCPPCGETVTFRGISWIVVRDGKFREGWQHSNIPEVLARLRAASPA